MAQSFWSQKPWWCQPWSILLTGAVIMAGSWLLFERWWLTALVSLPVLAWWGLFLVVGRTPHRLRNRRAEAMDPLQLDPAWPSGVPLIELETALEQSLLQSGLSRQDYIKRLAQDCLLYTSPSPRDYAASRMPSSA